MLETIEEIPLKLVSIHHNTEAQDRNLSELS